ncbi:MAG: extracellular solute-binding protein [Firmicutes bacterium]|nr:extracellular solute-binding protein [Bacillota bacterium]
MARAQARAAGLSRRNWFMAMGGSAGMLLTAGCLRRTGPAASTEQPQQPAPGPATLLVMLRENPEELALFDQVFARFAQQYPAIKLDRVLTSGGTDFNDKMTSLIAAGTPVALSGPWGSGGYRVWAVQGLVAELDQFVGRDRYDLTDFFPTQREFTKLQGRRYALPMAQYPQLLAYNSSLFDQAGVPPPPGWGDRTWTWAQYLRVARSLTAAGDPAQARWGSGNAWGGTTGTWPASSGVTGSTGRPARAASPPPSWRTARQSSRACNSLSTSRRATGCAPRPRRPSRSPATSRSS